MLEKLPTLNKETKDELRRTIQLLDNQTPILEPLLKKGITKEEFYKNFGKEFPMKEVSNEQEEIPSQQIFTTLFKNNPFFQEHQETKDDSFEEPIVSGQQKDLENKERHKITEPDKNQTEKKDPDINKKSK